MMNPQINTWLPADKLSALVLDVATKTPILPEMLQEVWRMSLDPHCIILESGEGKRCKSTLLKLDEISKLPDLTLYASLRELKVHFASIYAEATENYVIWRKLLESVGKLRNVSKMELTVDLPEQTTQGVEALREWGDLMEGVKDLCINFDDCHTLTYLPTNLPNVEKIEIMQPVSLEELSAISMPKLKYLHATAVNNLESLAQLTDAFPLLESINLKNERMASDSPLKLGNISDNLKTLSIKVPFIDDWKNLADSNVQQLQLKNCTFDPSFLQDCCRLRVLQIKNCVLKKAIPGLSKLEHLDTLVINGCFVTDYSFAKGLTQMKVLNTRNNHLNLEHWGWKEEELPKELECLQDMPNLMELCMDVEDLRCIFYNCPKRFQKYFINYEGIMRLK